MKLSLRLEKIAAYVRSGSRIADIGTDHAYIPIELVRRQVVRSALAMDIRKGPLERAQNNICIHKLEGQVRTRLSDGLKQLMPKEADTVIIAGMGGELIIHILEGGKHLWNDISSWILSPQSDLSCVRHFLEQSGFCIQDESMVCEDGKFYHILLVVRGTMKYQREADYQYGKSLIEKKDPVLYRFLKKEQEKLQAIIRRLENTHTEQARKRRRQIARQMKQIEEILHEM